MRRKLYFTSCTATSEMQSCIQIPTSSEIIFLCVSNTSFALFFSHFKIKNSFVCRYYKFCSIFVPSENLNHRENESIGFLLLDLAEYLTKFSCEMARYPMVVGQRFCSPTRICEISHKTWQERSNACGTKLMHIYLSSYHRKWRGAISSCAWINRTCRL